MAMNLDRTNHLVRLPNGGPSIKAPSLWSSNEGPGGMLTKDDRSMLAVIATVVRYKKHELIYQEGSRASYVFNIIAGVVKSYRSERRNKHHIMGFLFPDDIFGLTADGTYVNSAATVTPVTLYKIPVVALEARLRRNPQLDFQVICRLCHELRGAQQHAFLLSRHRAITKLGLFLQLLETNQYSEGRCPEEIRVPMSRSEIGEYIDVAPEAVSRALQELVRRNVIRVRDRRFIVILDRAKFDDIVMDFRQPELLRGDVALTG